MELDAMYRGIVETSPDGIWVFDLAGRTLYANPEIARMLGVEHAEMADLTVFDSLDETGRAQFREHLDGLRLGQVNAEEVEVLLQRRDGSTTWTLVREHLVPGPDGALAGVLHRFSDYSSRREMVGELRVGRERLAEAQRIARLAGWSWDVDADRLTGSPELLTLFGVDAATVPTTFADLLTAVHPADRRLLATAVRHVLDSAVGGEVDLDTAVRLRIGAQWVWSRLRGVAHRDAAGRVSAMSGTVQDVTETKQAELALIDLVEQNTLLQAVASAANESRSLVDLLGQCQSLVLLHDDWTRGRAFVPDETGRGVRPLYVTEEDRRRDLDTPAACAMELEVAGRAHRSRRPEWDAARLTIGFPVLFDDAVCAVVTITSDPPLYRHAMIESMVELVAVQIGRVAEREKAERELADARDAAMEASRQKSEFLATMSHEIRTPLNGVIGLNDLLLRSELQPDQRRLASGVQVASRALLGVINDVLDFSKIEAGRLQLERLDFEVRTVLDQVAEILGGTAHARGLELIVSCHPDVPEVLSGDPTRIAQVLTNLVSNAVKFTEAGEVVVRATATAGDAGRTVLEVEVRDTGIGIDSDAEHLFSPFTQADASTTRRYGGTGLGLAISREIVEALGGTLRHAPNPGGGSVFTFTAVLDPPVGAAPDQGDAHARRLLSGRRALVVDDHAHNRTILEEQLGWWGVAAASADGVDAALAKLAQARALDLTVDAVLVDLAMPDRDGLELVRALRADSSYDGVALLVLTSMSTVRRDEVLAAGASDCLTKPVAASVLRAALVEHLAGTPAVSPSTGSVEPASAAGPAHRVLVVEDNPVNQLVATGLLESLGYVVEVAHDGRDALEATDRGRFDAILMDVQMPRMDGYAATRALRAREQDRHTPRVPVVAMTAAAVDGERERCLQAGMDDFLTKPVDPTAVERVLRAVIAQAAEAPPEPAAEVPPGAEGLDVVRLGMLRDLDGDDTSYLDRAITNFVDRSTAALDALHEAAREGDAARLRQVAHKLVGNALNLGAVEAAEATRPLEDLGDRGTVDGALALLPRLEESLEHSRRALRAFQASYS